MNFARLSTLYWTQSLANLDPDGDTINADVDQTFTKNLLDKANDWIVAVERFELSCNGIPYYAGEEHLEEIVVYTRAANADDDDIETTRIDVGFNAYSIPNLLDLLNVAFGEDNDTRDANFELSIDADGFISFTNTNLDIYPVFPDKLNTILGLFDDENHTVSNTQDWVSEYPRWGLGDELDHITIKSNLNLVSDTIGQEKTNIVTDLSVPSNLSAASDGSFGYSARDKIIYTPSERRYLNFNSTAPIQVLRLYCEYNSPDGTKRLVKLPPGGVFNIKLAFFHRI